MRLRTALPLVLATAALSGCASTTYAARPQTIGFAAISSASGEELGMVNLSSLEGKITLAVRLKGISPGSHGFHFHAVGACQGPDFTSAGGHLNPMGKAHGRLNPSGAHLGDLPNIEVAQNGSASLEIAIDGKASDLLPALFDADGTAVMVHAGPDDYRSDPAGAAGPRIACGVLERQQG